MKQCLFYFGLHKGLMYKGLLYFVGFYRHYFEIKIDIIDQLLKWVRIHDL